MEINTSYEISEKESLEICKSHIEYDIFANKKWVAVDDLIEKLNSICEHEAEDTYENDMEAMGLLCDFVDKLEKKKGR